MSDLKRRTAGTLKWNTIDRVSTQVLYAVVGVILANILSKEEFGLVGALAIFQAFAIIFVDSGFGASLLREKEPTQADYSTVFWFNLIVSVGIYVLLYIGAPLIARIFGDNDALIPMSKVMFLTFVINGLSIVQTNRLMKRMEVKMIAVSNSVALLVSGIVGVTLAFRGYGAWAMVWYSVIMAAVKTLILWFTGGWWPSLTFSRESMRKVRRVGVSVFSSSLLNTISQNVYNFVIGVWYGLAPLGVYTQADKYSKMFTASISQVLTASFVPLLSGVQDSVEAFRRYCDKTGRFAAFILLPAMLLLTVAAPNLFHALFADKWDDAVILFQLLCVRGVFVVLMSLYSNYLLSLGKARHLIVSEGVKDGLLFAAILVTVWWHSVPVLVWGLLGATIVTWLILLYVTAHGLPLSVADLLRVNVPFLLPSAAMCCVAWFTSVLMDALLPAGVLLHINAMIILGVQSVVGILTYMGVARMMRLDELREAIAYLGGRLL